MTPEALPERVPLDQRLELGYELRVQSECKLALDQLFNRHQSQLFEPYRLDLQRWHVGKRRPTPFGERFSQLRSSHVRLCRSRLRHQRLESHEIELLRGDLEPVPRWMSREGLGAHDLAERGDLVVQ